MEVSNGIVILVFVLISLSVTANVFLAILLLSYRSKPKKEPVDFYTKWVKYYGHVIYNLRSPRKDQAYAFHIDICMKANNPDTWEIIERKEFNKIVNRNL